MKVPRSVVLQIFVIAVFAIIIVRLFYLQMIDNTYKQNANNNVLRYEVQNPPRGEIFDRNGEYIVQSKEVYDLMMIPKDVKEFDTLLLCSIVGEPIEDIRIKIDKAKRHSWRQGQVILEQLPKEVKIKLDERSFPGFYTVYRTMRSYPRKIAGNLLGYIGKADQRALDRDPYYKSGDYIGKTGIELAFEDILRGDKGVKINMVDVHGVVKGSYANGMYDTLAKPGTAITCTIDAELQAFAEELFEGKVGSIVAIEPSTGEILLSHSSPSYDPDEMVGREVNKNFPRLNSDPRKPFFNRAVMSVYPPGSVFKIVNGLIGLEEGVLKPEYKYPCARGYTGGRGVACHNHTSPLNLTDAIKSSCNAYFCYVLKNVLENRKYGSVKDGFDVWEKYVRSFGFGRKLDSDFPEERNGMVPTRELYDKNYRGSWNAFTVISLSIGQGELGVSPLQMANLSATIANRGYYYIPHVVKKIHDRDSIDARFYEPHYTMVDPKHFEPMVEGMWRAVHRPEGTARIAEVPGLDICGKTGTAQNPHGADHSTFLCFAPRDNPKIAISVYVEHGRWGGTSAAPIASLIVEKYLTGKISRPELVEYVKNMQIAYPYYDRQRTK